MEGHTEFYSALEDWYREHFQDAINELENQSPNVTFAFRPNQVVDGSRANTHQIEASDEHIARWDTRAPTIIFKKGFAPRISHDKPIPQMYNFSRYQEIESVASVFVAAARCFQTNENVPHIWKPLTWNKGVIYEYAVSGSYGGIDVNATMGAFYFARLVSR